MLAMLAEPNQEVMILHAHAGIWLSVTSLHGYVY